MPVCVCARAGCGVWCAASPQCVPHILERLHAADQQWERDLVSRFLRFATSAKFKCVGVTMLLVSCLLLLLLLFFFYLCQCSSISEAASASLQCFLYSMHVVASLLSCSLIVCVLGGWGRSCNLYASEASRSRVFLLYCVRVCVLVCLCAGPPSRAAPGIVHPCLPPVSCDAVRCRCDDWQRPPAVPAHVLHPAW
jgi:hypothetical protein